MQDDKFKFQTVANTRQMVPAKKSQKKTNLLKKKILKLSHTLLFIIVLRLVAGKSHHSFIILTSNCASHHNACKFSFFISADGSAPAALASLLFDPPEPQSIWKKTMFRDFSTFSRTLIVFLLTLSLL